MQDRPLADEDGNTLPPIDPNSDVARLIYLLEYGRLRGFRIGPRVQVGGVVLEVADLRLSKEDRLPEDRGIWAEHGYEEKG